MIKYGVLNKRSVEIPCMYDCYLPIKCQLEKDILIHYARTQKSIQIRENEKRFSSKNMISCFFIIIYVDFMNSA